MGMVRGDEGGVTFAWPSVGFGIMDWVVLFKLLQFNELSYYSLK